MKTTVKRNDFLAFLEASIVMLKSVQSSEYFTTSAEEKDATDYAINTLKREAENVKSMKPTTRIDFILDDINRKISSAEDIYGGGNRGQKAALNGQKLAFNSILRYIEG